MSSRFVGGALNDRDELVSLLCTPSVGSSLGRVRANRCTNSLPSCQLYSPAPANQYDNQHHQQARGSTGSRSGSQSQGYAIGHQTAWPDQYHKQSQAYNAEGMTAGQFQNVHRPEAYTAGLQSAVPLQYNDYARSHASGSRTVPNSRPIPEPAAEKGVLAIPACWHYKARACRWTLVPRCTSTGLWVSSLLQQYMAMVTAIVSRWQLHQPTNSDSG